jgi:NodT family efflux transporter outer membrane factor (OMF) lipoprotein
MRRNKWSSWVVVMKAASGRRFVLVLCGILLVQTLGGCILGTERPDIALDIPRAYRAAGRAPEAAMPKLDWWREFRSRELTALIEEAEVANFDIAAAVARIVQADAQARITGAALLPTVDFNASATRTRTSQAGIGGTVVTTDGVVTSSGGGGGQSERVSYRTSLSASYQLDFWGKNRAALRSAEEVANAARFDREVVALTTMTSVANAYFLVLGAQDRLRIANENLRSATRILDLIRQRVAVGTASELDTAQQETLVAVQRAAIPPLDQQVRQSMATLGLLVGRPPEYLKVRGGSMSAVAIPRVTPGLPSQLIVQRPDIREAEANLASANANVEVARAAFLPSIQLTGEYGVTSTALKNLFTPQAIFYQIAAGLTQPIFHGGALQGQLDLQRGKQEELLQTYRKSIISAFTDVEKALIAVQNLARQEQLQSQAVASSRRAFELSETRLRQGTIDLVVVLTAQQSLFQAQDNLSQVRLARLQAMVALFQALGGGWPAKRDGLIARETPFPPATPTVARNPPASQ